MSELKVTSIEELLKYRNGNVVELPAFAEGQPFYAVLRRPSMMGLVKAKKIPNQLLTTANRMFEDGVANAMDSDNEEIMDDMFSVIDVICEASFISPTYEELKKNDIELTDEQLLFIFNYSQTGVKALEPFRK